MEIPDIAGQPIKEDFDRCYFHKDFTKNCSSGFQQVKIILLICHLNIFSVMNKILTQWTLRLKQTASLRRNFLL